MTTLAELPERRAHELVDELVSAGRLVRVDGHVAAG